MSGKCIICGLDSLEELQTTKKEVFAVGRSKKFERGKMKIVKVICKNCGTVQFLHNEDYKNVIAEVYKNYDVMQDKAWSADKSEYKPRLQVQCERISRAVSLPKTGNVLDIGCGGGEFLFHFKRIYPEWELYGMDIGESFKEMVTEGDYIKDFFSSLEEIRNSKVKFDFISINNVLSLADNPAQILRTVHDVIADDGIFLVKDADFEVHPWILYEIESSAFYTRQHMANVLGGFGFSMLNVDFELEKKEIGIFSRKSNLSQAVFQNLYKFNKEIYDKKIEYLNHVIDIVHEYLEKNICIGIFGTSIAGVWVSEIIANDGAVNSDKKIFYVDEDEDFIQKKVWVNGYPIHRLEDVPAHAVVFLPFPQYIAENIKKRCEKIYTNLEFVCFEQKY